MAPRPLKATLVLSLIAAVAATLVLHRVADAPKAEKAIATRGVVIALQDIEAGQPLPRASVGVAQFPVMTVPRGAYSVVDSVVGRIVHINIYKGEVIVPRLLAQD